MITEVHLGHRDIHQLAPFVGSERVEQALAAAAKIRDWLGGRTIWNISSTAVGGGVAEMLVPLLSYSRSLGVRIRWLVIEGNPRFFHVTKRVHHALHGSHGDGSPLGDEAQRIYLETSRANAEALEAYVQPRDIALLHDPQTAGLAAPLSKRGALTIWRCHIGHDEPLPEVQLGWSFLQPHLQPVLAFVFSREPYVPSFCDRRRTFVIQPSIDAISPKNQPLARAAIEAILHRVGVIGGPAPSGTPTFVRTDGSDDTVKRAAEIVRQGEPPAVDTPLVVQVSRWDPLKDMVGVMRGFAQLVEEGHVGDSHLLLAGPDVRGVADDPEGPRVFAESAEAWKVLPPHARDRVTLAMLPTTDIEENAAIVNAIQSHAAVVTQKSLEEGFGLTVTEAMWKSRPVVASAVGGIRDQIVHGVHGLLLDDPLDLRTFRGQVQRFLHDAPDFAARCGQAARERVRERFLGVRHLLQYAELLPRLRP